jgi:hypothetical protein
MADLKADGVAFDGVKVEGMLFDIEARIVRSQILAGEPRIDGRDTRTVRPIEIRNGVLPRTHGSALFTRGETQALVVTTLGTERDAQRIDALASSGGVLDANDARAARGAGRSKDAPVLSDGKAAEEAQKQYAALIDTIRKKREEAFVDD